MARPTGGCLVVARARARRRRRRGRRRAGWTTLEQLGHERQRGQLRELGGAVAMRSWASVHLKIDAAVGHVGVEVVEG